MTPNADLYFDHYQGDPEGEPLAFGSRTTLEDVYHYEPIPPVLTPSEARHILGAQANLWTEYIETSTQVEYMLFPRLFALAEVVWSPAGARDWTSFRARLEPHLRRLDRMGVNYRRPAPGE